MARDTLSPWRRRAREVIDRVVEERRGEEPEAVLRAVRAAYPFGPRVERLEPAVGRLRAKKGKGG